MPDAARTLAAAGVELASIWKALAREAIATPTWMRNLFEA